MIQKITKILALGIVLFVVSVSAQIGELQQPTEQYRRYAAGSVKPVGPAERHNLYLATYDFKDIPGKSGFLGIWGVRFAIQLSAVDLTVNPGYTAEVCGTIAGTSRILCMPKIAGNNSLKEFSDIGSIRMTKVRKNDEVVMWYGLRSLPVAIPAPANKPPGFKFFSSPWALWIPDGYWVRLCTAERQTASNCETYTADASNIKGKHEFIYSGKGNPPPFPLSVVKPDIVKSPRPIRKTNN